MNCRTIFQVSSSLLSLSLSCDQFSKNNYLRYKLETAAVNWQLLTLNTCSTLYGNTVPGGTAMSRISKRALKALSTFQTINHTQLYSVNKTRNKTLLVNKSRAITFSS